jgi:hypothetical protein
MMHGEFVMMHPEEFTKKAMEFCSDYSASRGKGYLGI